MDSENYPSPRPATDLSPNRSRNSRWIPLIHLLFVIVLLAILTPYEWDRVNSENQQLPWLTRFFLNVNVDTTPYFILLLLSPLCWFLRPPIHSRFFSTVIRPRLTSDWVREKQASKQRDFFACLLSMLVAASSFLLSVWTASHVVNEELNIALGDLPPAYHDEYSYLFQANTFLAGQTSFPSHPGAPEIFDQVHVLNEGKLASRYFPGTGLWLAPFVAWGHPYWGYWLAGAITAFFIFWAGRELAGNGVGLLAGLIIALSPGMAIFSNLLLAHHPTLVGLSLFLWAFLRMQRTRSFRDALLAGLGLSFGMLCRPMTAASFALPFGIWLGIEVIRYYFLRKSEKTTSESMGSVYPLVAGLAIPLGCGLIGLFIYNQSITGSGWKMPYQLYTDIYTPRHVYGFNNVIRGEQKLGPKVLDNYDKWAENLTPALAARNVQNRILASLQWTLGIIPLGLAGLIFLITEWRQWSRWWLIFASIVSLHIAHIPYWYDGIMHWHYVFETGPLWALIFARVTQTLFRIWHRIDRPLMSGLWACLTLVAVLTNLTAIPPFWSVSKLEIVVNNVAFSKFKHFQFQQMIYQHPQIKQPALILVKHDPSDRHIDYVINDPQLDQAILIGRDRPDLYSPAKLQTLFPDRNLYLFDAAQNRLSRWNGAYWEPIR
ncbi:ArnT family glycosyltransferase [Gimesia fumaroli]|uniref:Glycosyltransferase RgtA/B/C/D-like domain-containing protein n=1 Tax=Gimesia fumaroli TaxID=2527976 RepID=A0A518IEG1_9PLAN|nr:glycosyltransferase family 39 protein [Gimesia fumaroli]QDV51476.1 hypothetical protein Enr17x_35320 [Gimesia fumaroli]